MTQLAEQADDGQVVYLTVREVMEQYGDYGITPGFVSDAILSGKLRSNEFNETTAEWVEEWLDLVTTTDIPTLNESNPVHAPEDPADGLLKTKPVWDRINGGKFFTEVPVEGTPTETRPSDSFVTASVAAELLNISYGTVQGYLKKHKGLLGTKNGKFRPISLRGISQLYQGSMSYFPKTVGVAEIGDSLVFFPLPGVEQIKVPRRYSGGQSPIILMRDAVTNSTRQEKPVSRMSPPLNGGQFYEAVPEGALRSTSVPSEYRLTVFELVDLLKLHKHVIEGWIRKLGLTERVDGMVRPPVQAIAGMYMAKPTHHQKYIGVARSGSNLIFFTLPGIDPRIIPDVRILMRRDKTRPRRSSRSCSKGRDIKVKLLDLAERVLTTCGRPMVANDMWAEGVRMGLTQDIHTTSRKPGSTLSTRLSEDIKWLGSDSIFSRQMVVSEGRHILAYSLSRWQGVLPLTEIQPTVPGCGPINGGRPLEVVPDGITTTTKIPSDATRSIRAARRLLGVSRGIIEGWIADHPQITRPSSGESLVSMRDVALVYLGSTLSCPKTVGVALVADELVFFPLAEMGQQPHVETCGVDSGTSVTTSHGVLFADVAKQILAKYGHPLTATQIWEYAVVNGLSEAVNTASKEPGKTMGSCLFKSSERPGSPFVKIQNGRLLRYALAAWGPELQQAPQLTLTEDDEEVGRAKGEAEDAAYKRLANMAEAVLARVGKPLSVKAIWATAEKMGLLDAALMNDEGVSMGAIEGLLDEAHDSDTSVINREIFGGIPCYSIVDGEEDRVIALTAAYSEAVRAWDDGQVPEVEEPPISLTVAEEAVVRAWDIKVPEEAPSPTDDHIEALRRAADGFTKAAENDRRAAEAHARLAEALSLR